ncbi:MAG: hypothetical protein MJ032_04940 [Acidaminococcaceae bacterium]|nr:hypothetical protein [Acidaminococcaceae bacterium]
MNEINNEKITEKEKKEQIKIDKQLQKKREYYKEHQKRFQKRLKLKNAVANFYTKLQALRGTIIDKNTFTSINISIRHILELPYRWTDKDMARAMTALSNLEKKYLKKRYTNPPNDETQLQGEINNLFAESTLEQQAKIGVVLNVLREQVEQQYLQGAEKMEQSPTNALLLLTQNLKHNMPDWFHKELLNLLYNQYKGKDFNEFMKQIRNELQKKRIKENVKTLNTSNNDE